MEDYKKKNKPDSQHRVRLEAKCRDDNAWYNCDVSFSALDTSHPILQVRFLRFKSDSSDIIVDKEEAFEHVRVQSAELSKGECIEIYEGEKIAAMQNALGGWKCLIDAEVEKVNRAKHSNRMICRCSFDIRWLDGVQKGQTITVPASSIRRLSKESISAHPTISAFLETSFTTEYSKDHVRYNSEDSDAEFDIQSQLEKQIEEIVKLAESIEIPSLKDMSFSPIKVDGQYNNRTDTATAEQESIYREDAPLQNAPRKRSKFCITALTQSNFLFTSTSLLEMEKRPRLSPLAARAAMAASVWNLPLQKEEKNGVQGSLEARDRNISKSKSKSGYKGLQKQFSTKLTDAYSDRRSQLSKPSKTSSVKATSRQKVAAPKKQSNRSLSSAEDENSPEVASTAHLSSPNNVDTRQLTQEGHVKGHREVTKKKNFNKITSTHATVTATRSSPRFSPNSFSPCVNPLLENLRSISKKHGLVHDQGINNIPMVSYRASVDKKCGETQTKGSENPSEVFVETSSAHEPLKKDHNNSKNARGLPQSNDHDADIQKTKRQKIKTERSSRVLTPTCHPANASCDKSEESRTVKNTPVASSKKSACTHISKGGTSSKGKAAAVSAPASKLKRKKMLSKRSSSRFRSIPNTRSQSK